MTPEVLDCVRALESEHRRARANLLQYAKKMKTDPLEAFQWVGDRVYDAALCDIFSKAIKVLEEETNTPDGVMHYCSGELLHLASSGAPRSTGLLDVDVWASRMRAFSLLSHLLGELS